MGSLGRSIGEPSIDDLLNAAMNEGGELARAAERLTDPKKTALGWIGDRTWRTLNGFIDTIQAPMHAVAGLIDPNLSVADAVKQNVSPGDVLMGDGPSKYDPWVNRAGFQTSKFIVDTLLDPLTYVTFGASRGIIGLSKGADAFASAKVAESLGVREGMRVYLSEAGEDLADRYLKAQRKGMRETFLKNERIKMVNKGLDEEEITRRLVELDEKTNDYLIAEILGKPLNKKQASQAVANIFTKVPEGMSQPLAKKFMDQGGIKFFGRSILSGQRIKAVRAMLPGMTMLDRAMEPVRGYLGNAFSTNYVNGNRMTDQYVDIQNKYRNLYEAQRDQLSQKGYQLKRQLKLSDEEWEFVTAAVERGLVPADARAADVWYTLHKKQPPNGTIREEVWMAQGAIKDMTRQSRRELIKAGIQVRDLPNYLPHLFVRSEVKNLPFKPSSLRETSNRTKFSKVFALEDDKGVRTTVRAMSTPDANGNLKVMVGIGDEAQVKTIRFIDGSKELGKVEQVFARQSESIQKELRKVVDSMLADRKTLKGAVATRTVDDISRLLDDIPDILPEDKKLLADEISKFVTDADVDKIIDKRLERFYDKGVKLSNGQTIKQEDIAKLTQDLVMAKGEATSVVSRINKLLATDVKLPHKKKARPATLKKEVSELAEQIKEEAKKIKANTVARKLDTDKVQDLLKQVVARTSKNPSGLNRIIDRLISNKQLARDLKDELGDVSRAFEIEKQQILEGAGKWMDETGKVQERVRAYVDDARKLGVDFEENALVTALVSSDDAIRVSTARHFTREVGEKIGRPESTAPDGWVRVNKMGLKYEGEDLSKYLIDKNGEPLYFPPDVAEHIETFSNAMDIDQGIGDFFRAYDSIQNYFKAAVTSIFPAFHGRNALSNVFLAYNKIGLEAINPASHVAASNIMGLERKTKALQVAMIKNPDSGRELAQLMKKEVFTDVTGYRWTWGELRTQIVDNVVAFHHRNLGTTDQLRFGVSQVREASARMFPKTKAGKIREKYKGFNPFSTDNHLFQAGFTKLGQPIEDYSRTLLFLSQLKKSGDPIIASRVTKMALFDYSNLTKFEKAVMRRIVPFYSFSRKNLELQLNTLVTSPGRISQQIRAVQSLGDYFREGELSEEELAKLPEWARQGYNVVKDRDGSHITLLRTLGTPLEELFNRTDPKENLGIVSPLIKAPIEFASGYSFFYGRPISEVTNADAYQFAPDFIKDFIGYEKVSGTDRNGNTYEYHTSFLPQNMYILNNIQPVGRLMSEINRAETASDPAARLNAVFFGFGTRDFDLAREEQRRLKENRQALIDILEQGGVGYTFERYVPEDSAGRLGGL